MIKPFGCAKMHKRAMRLVPVAAAKKDTLLRSISDMGEVAILVVDSTNLVSEAAARHKTAPTSTAALGRTLTGALLLGAFRKDDEKIQITFQGDGPLGQCMAVSDTYGNVRGKVSNPSADPPLYDNGKLNVAAAVGNGILSVIRSHPLEPNPYTGMTQIVSGEIAEDLANYLVESEQTNSAIALGVTIDRDCAVKAAEETVEILEKNLARITSVSQTLDGLGDPPGAERLRPPPPASDLATNPNVGPFFHPLFLSIILEGLGVPPGADTTTPSYRPCNQSKCLTDPSSTPSSPFRSWTGAGKEVVREAEKLEVAWEAGKLETLQTKLNNRVTNLATF
eukprot:gene896-5692_t